MVNLLTSVALNNVATCNEYIVCFRSLWCSFVLEDLIKDVEMNEKTTFINLIVPQPCIKKYIALYILYMVVFLFTTVICVFVLLCLRILIVCSFIFLYLHRASWHSSATLTEVFLCFFLSCKANARVKPAKMGHGPHYLLHGAESFLRN